MFEKLRSALKTLNEAITERSLDEKEIDKILWDFELALLESDVAHEIVKELTVRVKKKVIDTKIKRSIDSKKYIKDSLLEVIKDIFSNVNQINLIEIIKNKKKSNVPFTILFLGINGSGKTTTIAKLANLLKNQGFSLIIACSDTYRAGAIEQLTQHAKNLSIKTIVQKYGADPAAVARDAVLHAKLKGIDVVLIDTAGRIQTSKNLMDEMSKIIRVVNPDFKIFVGDSLAGNDVIYQAKEFHSITNFDAAILTKADADVKGGAILSISYITNKPIIFIGCGQDYNDLKAFNVDSFVNSLFDSE